MKPRRGDILDIVQRDFRTNAPARMGIAVSGGGDSIALLHALSRCFSENGTKLFAVTVDHGLRAEAAKEARFVGEVAASLGVSHDVLKWEDWDGSGNVQAASRAARYRLMTAWAREREISVLAMGHTADDQAETVLMRLARSAGVDGLAGIPRRRAVHGITIVRPLLDVTRAALRDYLRDQGQTWIDDPSNEDTRFERVRMRAARDQLAELGLTTDALVGIAENMARSREALDWYAFISAREMVQLDGGDVLMDLRKFRTLPEEIARRLLVQALRWIGGGPYQPRRGAVADALASIRTGKTTTLNGCAVVSHGGLIWICREFNAVRDLEAGVRGVWDKRWRINESGCVSQDWRLRALGRTGLKKCGDWRLTGRPFAALIASPSVWDGDKLIAAPLAGCLNPVQIELIGGGEEFFASILSH